MTTGPKKGSFIIAVNASLADEMEADTEKNNSEKPSILVL